MTREHEYPPPPNTSHEEGDPFLCGTQQQMPPSENPQTSPAAAANMQEGPRAMQGYAQTNPYGPTYGQPHSSTPQQLAQRGLAVGPSQDSAEHRSKASRACDECRRKKTKCDADSEQPGVQCSACRRTNQTCSFTRPPQKRGPNKGYIKDLEHRLRGVESQLGTNAPGMQYSHMVQEGFGAFPVPIDHSAKKRIYEMVEGASTFNQAQPHYQLDHSQQQNTYQDSSTSLEQSPRTVPILPGDSNSSQNMYIAIPRNNYNVDLYYNVIHPHHPVLAHGKSRQQRLLDGAERDIIAAFFAALEAGVVSCTSTDSTALTSATTLLDSLRLYEPTARTLNGNHVYFQTLVLVIIAKENSGPLHAKDTIWYHEAVRVGIFLQLHKLHNIPFENAFEESLPALGRRIWLVLATLDRWQAASKTGMMLIARGSVQLVDSDEQLMGSSAYQLTRLSNILGQISEGFLYHSLELQKRSRGLLTEIMYDNLDNFRKSVQGLFATTPHLQLACLHSKLIADRHMELYVSNATQIEKGALQIVALLRQKPGPNPLTHHWAGLAAATLTERLGMGLESPDPDEFTAALHSLREGLQTGQIRHCDGNKTAWDQTIASFITKKLDPAQRLESLADAAVGTSQAKSGPEGQDSGATSARNGVMDWSASTMEGYLNLFE